MNLRIQVAAVIKSPGGGGENERVRAGVRGMWEHGLK